MGLDMYLNAKKYISNFDFVPSDRKQNAEIKNVLGFLEEDFESVTVSLQVAYWRKANYIHKWFVDNVQKGTDDCGEYWVPNEKMRELYHTCTKALETKDATILSPTEGFFFGSTDIDQWYWNDIEYTKEKIKSLLEDKRLVGYDFYYNSSW